MSIEVGGSMMWNGFRGTVRTRLTVPGSAIPELPQAYHIPSFCVTKCGLKDSMVVSKRVTACGLFHFPVCKCIVG